MQISPYIRCEGGCIRSVAYLDRRLSTAMKPASVVGGTDSDTGAASTLPTKRMSWNSRTLQFHSNFKPSMGIEKYYCPSSKRARPVNARSFQDKGERGIPSQSNTRGSYNVLSLFAGVISNLIKGLMHFFTLERKHLGKLEDKIENAVDVVEELADTVNQVAKFTEDIAEKVEKNSNEDSLIHQTAAYVDNISEKVAKDAEIVENKAEQIKKILKSIDSDMEAIDDSVGDIEGRLFKEIRNGNDKSIETKKLLDPAVVTNKDQSV